MPQKVFSRYIFEIIKNLIWIISCLCDGINGINVREISSELYIENQLVVVFVKQNKNLEM